MDNSTYPKNIIIFLCTPEELQRERKGYADAFERLGYKVICSGNITSLSNILQGIEDRVLAIIQPEGQTPIHPFDIDKVSVPTVIFQWDTFTRTGMRARASLPYDVKIVCHPGYDQLFEKAGCTHTYVLPWCVDDKEAAAFEDEEKIYEVGWVGRFDGKFYSHRRSALEQLQKAGFVMNQIDKHYSWNEMFKIYKQSKIVVNISRDDYLEDANMRCFEAMGAGAMVITKMPTELSQLGFVNGEHFVGCDNLEKVNDIINYYLDNEQERQRISSNGKNKVLKSDTYISRAGALVKIVTDKRETVMLDNIFRKASGTVKMQQLAYTYWKDGDLQKMFDCLMMSKKRVPFNLLMLLLKLFLVKLKRILF